MLLYFLERFEVLNATFQAPLYVAVVTNIVYYDMYYC